jgi:hypothetical protein
MIPRLYQRSAAASGVLRARWFGLALILAASAFVLSTVPNLINQAGMLDPYVYTGYIHSYHELLEHFGRTYYSTRIAFIHPARALAALFGDYAGYVTLRYLALALALGSVWSIARRYYGARVAAFSVVFVALQPLFVRALLWDYVDGVATTYLLAAAACLIGLSAAPGPALWFAAGVCLALATNAHPFTLAVGGLFLPGWLIVQPAHWSWLRRVEAVATVASGFVVATLVLGALLRLESPAGARFYDSTSVAVALQLLRGGAVVWFSPWSAIPLSYRLFVLTPLFFALVLTVVASRARRLAHPRLCIAALVYILAVYGFYVVMHVVFKGGVFWTSHVLTYLFPAMTLVVVCLVGECVSRTAERSNQSLIVAAVACAVLWLVWRRIDPVLSRLPLWAFGLLAVAVLASVADVRLPRVSLAAVLVASVLSPITAYRAAAEEGRLDYSRIHLKSSPDAETVTYHAALHLMKTIGRLPDWNGPIVFLYGEQYEGWRPSLSLNSVQSTYLWGYTRLDGSVLDEQRLDVEAAKRLRQASKIVLLGHQQQEIDRYGRMLVAAGIVTKTIADNRFEESGLAYRTVVLDRLAPTGVVTPHSLRSFQASNGGVLLDRGGSIVMTTPPTQWAFAATAPIPPASRSRSSATLRLRLRVLEGEVGIGVTPAGDVGRFLSESAVKPTDAPHDVSVDVTSAGAGLIVLRSNAPRGVVTRAELFSMNLDEEPGPARPEARVVVVPIESVQPQNGGIVARTDGALTLTTPPQQWAFAAIARVIVPKEATGAAVVRVRVQVASGELGVAATPPSGASRLIIERSAVSTRSAADVSLAVPDVRQIGYVVFRSWAPGRMPTRARILGIEVVQPGS